MTRMRARECLHICRCLFSLRFSIAGAPASKRSRPGRREQHADVYEGFPRSCAVSIPRAFAQRCSADPRVHHADYLHFANGAFAGCSIPNPHPHTYRSGVGALIRRFRPAGDRHFRAARVASHPKTTDLAHARTPRLARADQLHGDRHESKQVGYRVRVEGGHAAGARFRAGRPRPLADRAAVPLDHEGPQPDGAGRRQLHWRARPVMGHLRRADGRHLGQGRPPQSTDSRDRRVLAALRLLGARERAARADRDSRANGRRRRLVLPDQLRGDGRRVASAAARAEPRATAKRLRAVRARAVADHRDAAARVRVVALGIRARRGAGPGSWRRHVLRDSRTETREGSRVGTRAGVPRPRTEEPQHPRRDGRIVLRDDGRVRARRAIAAVSDGLPVARHAEDGGSSYRQSASAAFSGSSGCRDCRIWWVAASQVSSASPARP